MLKTEFSTCLFNEAHFPGLGVDCVFHKENQTCKKCNKYKSKKIYKIVEYTNYLNEIWYKIFIRSSVLLIPSWKTFKLEYSKTNSRNEPGSSIFYSLDEAEHEITIDISHRRYLEKSKIKSKNIIKI